MEKLKQILLLAGEFMLVIVCCYFVAVIFTLFAVGFGSIDTGDTSVWSDHVRNMIGTIININK